MTHVDVIKNEWLAGLQMVVARVWKENDHVRVDAEGPWSAFVETYRTQAENLDDSAFLTSLHETMRGDYVYATEPHDEAACPFHQTLVLPLHALDPQDERHPAARGA